MLSCILESHPQAVVATVAEPDAIGSEWFTGSNPIALLRQINGALEHIHYNLLWFRDFPPAVVRRIQLFGCACARTVWGLLSTDMQNAVVVRERFADGRATDVDLRACALRIPIFGTTDQEHAAASAANAAGYQEFDSRDGLLICSPIEAAYSAARAIARRAAGSAPPSNSSLLAEWQAKWDSAYHFARVHQAELVRDIFPPPEHTDSALRLERAWLTSTVMTLARQTDDSGDYGVLPILADALQDAGCDNDFILDRCRAESGIHCRGNWVVDLLLGRE